MTLERWRGQKKKRPRSHVVAEMGVNFLERQVLRRGHQLRRVPQPEYGTDAQMHHWCPTSREPEMGFIEFQVKATEGPTVVCDGKYLTCRVTVSDLHYWIYIIESPVVLVLYDAENHRGYWLECSSTSSKDENSKKTRRKRSFASPSKTNSQYERWTDSEKCRLNEFASTRNHNCRRVRGDGSTHE